MSNPRVKYHYNWLEDFLISQPLSVDGTLETTWGARFPIKASEIDACILFADISGFSRLASQLSPIGTLIYVNHFFSWITAEALKGGNGIIDKYIGDEMMAVFSKEFGSNDAFSDALHAARWMAERDLSNFFPHIGIAAGPVTVGFVGTPLKYSCSVFGLPVTLAKRFAAVPPSDESYASIFFPADLWEGRAFEEEFPPVRYTGSGGKEVTKALGWELMDFRPYEPKNMASLSVREVMRTGVYLRTVADTDFIEADIQTLKSEGAFRPR